MSKTNVRSFINKVVSLVAVFALIAVYVPVSTASAAAITARKVVIGSSAPSASTTYAFTFTVPSATAIKSVDFAACTTASGACTPAPGFTSASSTLTGQPTNLGSASGWTVNVATTTSLRLENAANATAPSAASTVSFSTVTNPSAANSTFFMRITTYSTSTYTTAIDTGVVAAATAGQITVTATVDEALTFTLSAATVALGTITTGTTGKDGTVAFTASTNAASGYSVTYTGNTLSTTGGTIPAYAGSASAAGTAGFGFNLAANTVPTVGTAVSGTGTATASAGYNSANSFKFLSGDPIASVGAPSNSNTFTIAYVANISGATPAGAYTTTLSYVATPNF
jgi:hypothetical protein